MNSPVYGSFFQAFERLLREPRGRSSSHIYRLRSAQQLPPSSPPLDEASQQTPRVMPFLDASPYSNAATPGSGRKTEPGLPAFSLPLDESSQQKSPHGSTATLEPGRKTPESVTPSKRNPPIIARSTPEMSESSVDPSPNVTPTLSSKIYKRDRERNEEKESIHYFSSRTESYYPPEGSF